MDGLELCLEKKVELGHFSKKYPVMLCTCSAVVIGMPHLITDFEVLVKFDSMYVRCKSHMA